MPYDLSFISDLEPKVYRYKQLLVEEELHKFHEYNSTYFEYIEVSIPVQKCTNNLFSPTTLQAVAARVIRKKLTEVALWKLINEPYINDDISPQLEHEYRELISECKYIGSMILDEIITEVSNYYRLYMVAVNRNSVSKAHGFTFIITHLPKITPQETEAFLDLALKKWDKDYIKRGKRYLGDPPFKLQTMAIEVIRKQLFLAAYVKMSHIQKYRIFDFYYTDQIYRRKTLFLASCNNIRMKREALNLLRYLRSKTNYFEPP